MSRRDPEPILRGLSCPRCGGSLGPVDSDGGLLACSYCGHRYLEEYRGDAEAYAPAGRLGRRRALGALRRALAEVGVKGHVVEEARRIHLPFWDLQAKVVGWQRWKQPVPGSRVETGAAGPDASALRYELREESFGRNVSFSTPACDLREFGLVGVAGRVGSMRLRPFQFDRVPVGEVICGVLKPASVALRQARLYYAARASCRNAFRPVQRVLLVRPRVRLIYYPVWRVRYRSMGGSFEVVIDGLKPRILEGSYPTVEADHLPAWIAAAATGGLVAGVNLPVALAGSIAWTTSRLVRAGVNGRKGELAAWLRRQVGGRRIAVARFKA